MTTPAERSAVVAKLARLRRHRLLRRRARRLEHPAGSHRRRGDHHPWKYPLQTAVWKVLPVPAGHSGVDLVTFTGSTVVGRKAMSAAAVHGHRTQLELGGKAPFVVTGATIPAGLVLPADVDRRRRRTLRGCIATGYAARCSQCARSPMTTTRCARPTTPTTGLAASAWIRDVYRAQRASRDINAGCVWINDHLPIISEMPRAGDRLRRCTGADIRRSSTTTGATE